MKLIYFFLAIFIMGVFGFIGHRANEEQRQKLIKKINFIEERLDKIETDSKPSFEHRFIFNISSDIPSDENGPYFEPLGWSINIPDLNYSEK